MDAGNQFTCATHSASKTAMDARDHFTCASQSASKNGASPKSQMSRENFLSIKACFRIGILAIICTMPMFSAVFGQDTATSEFIVTKSHSSGNINVNDIQ